MRTRKEYDSRTEDWHVGARHASPVLALCALLFLAAARADAQDTSALAQGREAVESGHSTEARAALEPLARGDDARAAGAAWFYLGQLAEREFRFADAVSAYEASVARDEGGRYAARARARVEVLRAHAEGGFAPLAALERVRANPALASDPRALESLLHEARGFPPGAVRAEALLLVGQAYAGRLDRPHDAALVLRELASDRDSPLETRRLAVQLLSQAREQSGEYEAGLADVLALGGNDEQIARMRQLVRRERLRRASLVASGLALIAGVVSALRALREERKRRALARALRRPLPLAHIAMLSLGGALLAHTYEDHDLRPFLALGAGALVVYFAATAWSVTGSARPWMRVLRAVVCAAAVLGASFLAMYRYDVAMLEGIGL